MSKPNERNGYNRPSTPIIAADQQMVSHLRGGLGVITPTPTHMRQFTVTHLATPIGSSAGQGGSQSGANTQAPNQAPQNTDKK